jgi:hypothetical protein
MKALLPIIFLLNSARLSGSAMSAQANITPSFSDLYYSDLSSGNLLKDNNFFSTNFLRLSDPANDSLYYYNTGTSWGKVDPRKGLDTLRLYIELHPYATKYPGEVQDAIHQTIGLTSLLTGDKYTNFTDNYNWLVKIQPVNTEPAYQDAVMRSLAMDLRFIDLNDAANMWYNYSLLFPDSSDVAVAWSEIKSIRDYQKLIPEDTTPFHKLTFPLQPLPGGSELVGSILTDRRYTLSIVPNPFKDITTVTYELPAVGIIKISLYDILGTEIRNIVNTDQYPGTHSMALDLQNVSAGTYFLRMQYPGGIVTKQIAVQH